MAFSINGLSSGLDTAQIIKDLMDIERLPYTNLESKKTNLQTEQGVFRQLNTKLSALQRLASDMQYSTAFDKNKGTFSNASIGSVTTTDKAVAGSYDIKVTQLAQSQIIGLSGIDKAGDDLKDKTFTIGVKSIEISSLKLNGKSVETNEEALKALVNEINSAPGTYGGTASIVDPQGDGKYTLNITATGAANGNFTLKKSGDAETPANTSTQIQGGQEAEFTINGSAIKRPSNTISDVIPGVTLTLQSKDISSTLTIGKDVEAVTKQVQEFVTAYNDIVDLLKNNLAKPEGKDVVNPLQSDTTLKAIQNELYTIFTGLASNAGAKGTFMEEIGLSIDKGVTKGSLMTGKITFDKAAFETALKADPVKVSAVFEDRMKVLQEGLYNKYTASVKGTLSMKVTGYDSEIKMVDERLTAMEMRLEAKEARLKLQFGNMEVMLSSLKSEQSWLKSQFDMLTNSNK